MNLADINDAWNRRIAYLPEPDGQDDWQLPSETIERGTGDCEDYAIGKFLTIQWLTELTPKLVTCRLNGQAHVVVVVDDWVLDNAAPEIVKLKFRTDLVVESVSSYQEAGDVRFAWTMHRMDSIKELIAIKQWLNPKEA